MKHKDAQSTCKPKKMCSSTRSAGQLQRAPIPDHSREDQVAVLAEGLCDARIFEAELRETRALAQNVKTTNQNTKPLEHAASDAKARAIAFCRTASRTTR